MSIWSDTAGLFSALAGQDSFEIRNALRPGSMYVLGLVYLVLTGFGLAWLFKKAPLVERHCERFVMITCYLAIALIIFWGVIDRFVFSSQQPWSTTIPPLLFMIMAWFGAAFNVRVRTHLSFSEFRTMMPRAWQFACLCLDYVLWFGFALIFLVTTCRLVALSASNFQIVLGTDGTMQWWFLGWAPIAATLMAARATENLLDDLNHLRTGKPLIRQAVIGGNA